MRARCKQSVRLGLLAGLSLLAGQTLADAPATPERVRDLDYGTVLFEFYQGHTFAALSGLAIAGARGGIQGHGDDPRLVEGGLMLAYGMTREARALFEKFLQDSVSPGKRNQAWFYLGKVFYLEKDQAQAEKAFARIDGDALQEDAEDLHAEWLYLKGQLALGQGGAEVKNILASLPEDSLWRSYLLYNQAVHWISKQQPEQAIAVLNSLADDLHREFDGTPEQAEALALRERALLSLGQLQLQQKDYAGARASLQQISLDSAFADQALFHYAVAASQDQDYGLALQALNTLHSRPLFTPWLQQVPFARGFMYEQLKDSNLALQAYKSAAQNYQHLIKTLETERSQLSEAKIIAALGFERPDAPATPDPEPADVAPPKPLFQLILGEEAIPLDAYGRLQVQPVDFSLAALLATETFQLSLRDLHELYRLQQFLSRWQKQLAAFDLMLETRTQQRMQRIGQTRTALAAQQADQWLAQQADYNQAIKRALEEGNSAFFMSEAQQAFAKKIQTVQDKLVSLPDNATTAAQREKIRRIQAYFDWWVADQSSVNRWAAQKQLQGLNRAMEDFTRQTAGLEQAMALADPNAGLADRVRHKQQQLEALRAELEQALASARQTLVEQVRAALVRAEGDVKVYLRAARQAQARLSDALFRGAK